jgi:enterochelin esterase-like enzyme
MIIFDAMQTENVSGIYVEGAVIESAFLDREVKVDFYLPKNVADPSQMGLLLINDGQDMVKMGFEEILDKLYSSKDTISPVLCAAIHCSAERKLEYGVAGVPDYLGRGNKAGHYSSFIIKELLPYIRKAYFVSSFREIAFAGFSLGGLSALDIAWANTALFQKVGVFSGSLWWRNVDQDNGLYDEDKHRIIHQQIRKGDYAPGLKFFFQCGNLDETKDRNKNGIIDSIDDTLDLIKELKTKGYTDNDIRYLEFSDGKHDVPTWGRAMPEFLKWGWEMKIPDTSFK